MYVCMYVRTYTNVDRFCMMHCLNLMLVYWEICMPEKNLGYLTVAKHSCKHHYWQQHKHIKCLFSLGAMLAAICTQQSDFLPIKLRTSTNPATLVGPVRVS